MPKRKRTSVGVNGDSETSVATSEFPQRRSSTRQTAQAAPAPVDSNPDSNSVIRDGQDALRASPDDDEPPKPRKATKRPKKNAEPTQYDAKSDDVKTGPPAKGVNTKAGPVPFDPDGEGEAEEDAAPEELQEALARPPPVNSSYLPLPWKGRLGYACLCTYLRAANPPVFSSRTCRIASILEHRHPLKDPSHPAHAKKNRPDKEQPADIAPG